MFGLSLAAGGVGANLIVFLIKEFNIKSISATQISNVLLGCNNLFPIAAAIIADSFLGSFNVISISAFVSFLGTLLLTFEATIHTLRPPPCGIGAYTCESPSKLQLGVLYMALTLCSLGLGGTRYTIATMGADQFDKASDQGKLFNYYFLALYIASAISFIGVVYIQDNVGWGLGFGICAMANAIGLAAFLCGKGIYRQIKPKGSPFMSIARVVVAAIRKRKRALTILQDYHHENNGVSKMPINTPSKSFRFLNRAALKTENDRGLDGSYSSSWKLCTVKEVEDLKTLVKISPLWTTGILVSTTIGMFNNLTILQALTMDRHLGPNFKIPAGSFLVFNLLATAASIILIDRFLLPTWQNMTHRSLTLLQRIGTGHVINVLTMVGSALIEKRRLHVVQTQNLSFQLGVTVPMSSLWLVITLIIIGIGEAFHFPGQVALFYQEFPKSLRSTSTAMISLLLAVGFYLTTAITDLLHRFTGWLPNDINKGRLDNVYWMLALLGVINLGYFLICANLFSYQNIDEKQDGPTGLM
ncbi:PTR2 domain-containing protein [Cephalotus follicularis]|uniref:PTR2 domain-containing protein n=1 Tax=Cephalotus follicularis TaxID=3775 RepID=A0A1Q3B6Z0_CEPFO|nr:PTR2 domain-containing protein [Cephalotus follicularis]